MAPGNGGDDDDAKTREPCRRRLNNPDPRVTCHSASQFDWIERAIESTDADTGALEPILTL